MHRVDAKSHDVTRLAELLQELRDLGMSTKVVCKRVGVAWTTMMDYQRRSVAGEGRIPYPVQFALEALLDERKSMMSNEKVVQLGTPVVQLSDLSP